MANFDLEQWVASDTRISQTDWDQFRQQYLRNRGLDPEQWLSSPQHRVFAGRLSWLRLLPNDTVTRIQSADKLSSVIPDIIQETIKNIRNSGIDNDLSFSRRKSEDIEGLSDDERTNRIEAALCNHIVGTLKGDVEVERLSSTTHNFTPGNFDCPIGQLSVPVSIINSGQYTDYAIYTFDDAEDVFGSAYGNSTWMLKKIIERGAEPAAVVRNVAFTLQPNITWGAADPPNHSIAFLSMTGDTYEFHRVENPQQSFSASWGDVSAMNPTAVSENTYTARSVYWEISLGMS